MTVNILFFALYREQTGTKQLKLELIESLSVRQIAAQLEANHPNLKLKGALCAINEHYASPEQTVQDGDTLAFLPPVAGGSADDADRFFVSQEPLELETYQQNVAAPQYGAIASFLGTVRSPNAGQDIVYIDYQGYEAMIFKQMEIITKELRANYSLGKIVIAHRLGRLKPGEVSIAIFISSQHRHEALEACHAGIDRSKELLPVWKYEVSDKNTAWVKGVSSAGDTL